MATTTKRAWKLQEFVAHGGKVNCLALGHKSGRVMVTGGEDKKVNMWAVGKPNCIMSLSGHTSPVEAVRFGNEEEMVVAGSLSGALKIWDLEAAKIVRTLTGHKSSIRSLDFHPYGEFVASGSMDTNIKLWDIRRKGCIYTYKGHTNCVNSLRFSPDGRWIASASEDGTVKIWDLSVGKLLADLKGHSGPVNSVEFHPNEFLLASGSSDRTVKFWDLETLQLVGSTDGESAAIRTIFFHPEGSCLYSGGNDSLKVYGWEPLRTFDSLVLGWGRVTDIAIAQNQLIGGSFSQSNVSTYVVDIQRVQPLGGPPSPTVPVDQPQRSLSSSGRKNYHLNERPATQSSKAAPVPKEEPESDEQSSPQEDPGDDAASVADIKDPKDYWEIFQPKHRLGNDAPPAAQSPPKRMEPFPAPPDDVPAVKDMPKPTVIPAKQDKPTSANRDKTPAVVPANRDKPVGLNMDDFLPKQASPVLPEQQMAPDMSEAEAMSAILKGHDSMVAVMSGRQKNLQIVRALWTGGNTKTAVDSAIGMNDMAIIVDLLNILIQNKGLWNLDMVSTLLPQLPKLLDSKYENYVYCGCNAMKIILRNFASVIKANISAPPSIGVDISREERYRKCKACYGQLMNVRSLLDSKHGHNKLAPTFRELQLLMAGLD